MGCGQSKGGKSTKKDKKNNQKTDNKAEEGKENQPQMSKKQVKKAEQQRIIAQSSSKLKPFEGSKWQDNYSKKKIGGSLNLMMQNITDKDCEEIIKYDWTSVTVLDLQKNKLTTKGVKTILSIPWPSLQKILLSGNNIHEFMDFQKLLKQGFVPELKYISLSNNPLDAKAKSYFSNFKISHSDITVIV